MNKTTVVGRMDTESEWECKDSWPLFNGTLCFYFVWLFVRRTIIFTLAPSIVSPLLHRTMIL